MTEIVAEADVTLDRLEEIVHAAFMQTERSGVDRLIVREEGRKVYLKLHRDRSTVLIYLLRKLSGRYSEADKLAFLIALNNAFTFVRFGMHKPSELWCDHALVYSGGLAPVQLISTLRQVLRECHTVFAADLAGMIEPDESAGAATVRLVCVKCGEPMRVPAGPLAGSGPINVRCPACRAVLVVTPRAMAPPHQEDVVTAMRKLAELREMGAVTPEEFAAKKAELLKRL